MRALRERHTLTHDGKERELRKGDVMLIKGDEKNRRLWKIGIVEQLIPGRDGVVRYVQENHSWKDQYNFFTLWNCIVIEKAIKKLFH
jgi:hypothetical protein